MILITKGIINTIRLTLTEKCTLTNPYFLFIFRSKVSQDEVCIFMADTSNYTYRYNQFLFNELTYSMLEGYWTYEVYEMPTQSTDKTQGNKIEEGVLKVIDTHTITTTTYTTTSTATVYDSSPTA